MQTILETDAYLAAAADAGMTEDERLAVAVMIGANPMIGDIMVGTGGARKVRVRKPGRGKSGGYRVVTYYAGEDVPVFMLTVFGKGDKASLTKSERNAISKVTSIIVETLKGYTK